MRAKVTWMVVIQKDFRWPGDCLHLSFEKPSQLPFHQYKQEFLSCWIQVHFSPLLLSPSLATHGKKIPLKKVDPAIKQKVSRSFSINFRSELSSRDSPNQNRKSQVESWIRAAIVFAGTFIQKMKYLDRDLHAIFHVQYVLIWWGHSLTCKNVRKCSAIPPPIFWSL